jgi:hypothetical protein
MNIKLFGYRINLGKDKATKTLPTVDRTRATGAIRKQPKTEISFQIADIRNAVQQAKNAELPNRSRLHDIYRYILRDGHLKSQLRTAKYKVLSEPWLLYIDGKPDNAASELFRKRWFNQVIEYILETEFHGFSAVEFNNLDPVNANIGEVVLIDREFVSIEKQLILIEGTINGPYIPYGQIMYDIDLLEFGQRYDLGTLLECAYNVLWKYYSRSDWSRASEKFGMPILSIEAGTNNKTELDDLEVRAANFGTDGYIVSQQGDKVSVIERTGQQMHNIYKDNIVLCNEEISKIINGGTATTDQKSFVGSAEVQERTLEDFTTARMQLVVDEVNEKLLPYLIAKGFPANGRRFDFPQLIKLREQKINGKPTATDPKEAPTEGQIKKDEKDGQK